MVGSISSHPSIDCIRLENCFVDDTNGYDILCSLLTSDKTFAEIDFERNYIRTGGDNAIPDYLTTNPPLKYLCLANNNLIDEDAKLIARALKRNTNLEYLRVGQNDFTEIGRDALRDAIYNPTSLNSLADCNHTCSINGISFGNDISNNDGYKSNKTRKIYHLLSSRNREGSNVRHLNSEFGDEDEDKDSLVIVPKVLECLHLYDERHPAHETTSYVPPLSIMYEVLRSWKMPELYGMNYLPANA